MMKITLTRDEVVAQEIVEFPGRRVHSVNDAVLALLRKDYPDATCVGWLEFKIADRRYLQFAGGWPRGANVVGSVPDTITLEGVEYAQESPGWGFTFGYEE